MHAPSLFLLIGAAGLVAILHSILPDHWVPLAVVARAQRWSLLRVGRITLLASLGHVLASLILGGIIAMIGLQFQQEIDTQQGHIVGVVLMLTGLLFLLWTRLGRGPHGHRHGEGHTHTHSFGLTLHPHPHHEHAHDDHPHPHEHGAHAHEEAGHHEHSHDAHPHPHGAHAHEEAGHHEHDHQHHDHQQRESQSKERSLLKRLAAIAVPFGVAASPDLTILPVALAASALGRMEVVGVLSVFTLVTVATFIALTIVATLAGYQIKGAWIEKHATTITSLVLIGIGLVAFVGF